MKAGPTYVAELGTASTAWALIYLEAAFPLSLAMKQVVSAVRARHQNSRLDSMHKPKYSHHNQQWG